MADNKSLFMQKLFFLKKQLLYFKIFDKSLGEKMEKFTRRFGMRDNNPKWKKFNFETVNEYVGFNQTF